MRQLLDHAAENAYALPAFNVNNLEQVQAIMQAAAEVDSPVIMQASAGARKYAGEAFLRHLIDAAIEAYPQIPVVMHQDHGQSPAICMAAIRSGFSSVMMDGSWFHDSPEGMRRFRQMTTETAGFYNTVGFNDDTRAFLSIPARHDVARRIDCAFLAELVADHRLDEDEAAEIAVQLAYELPKKAYKLDGARC
jgi:glucuronate isomerase